MPINFKKNYPIISSVILNKVGHTPMEESPNESLKSVLMFI